MSSRTETLARKTAVLTPDRRQPSSFGSTRSVGSCPMGESCRLRSCRAVGLGSRRPETRVICLRGSLVHEVRRERRRSRIVVVARAAQDSRSSESRRPPRPRYRHRDPPGELRRPGVVDRHERGGHDHRRRGTMDGVVRVGSTDGSEPHLLLGHDGWIWDVDIDPARPLDRHRAARTRPFASGPCPTSPSRRSTPCPHDELVAKLKSLTNLRVVRDDESTTGWTLTHDPFPGWETVPSW